MSIVTLFTRTAPTLGGVEFDAVLEDTLEFETTLTDYPIESGARAVDHGILQPIRYSLIIAMSNNPIGTNVTDFIGGLTSNLIDSGLASQIAGLSAGFLGSSDDSRAAGALEFLITLWQNRLSFDVDAGDLQLSNMVVVGITRTKTPENENGLFARVSLRELTDLDTLTTSGNAQPSQDQLRDGDDSKTQCASAVNGGEQSTSSVPDSVTSNESWQEALTL